MSGDAARPPCPRLETIDELEATLRAITDQLAERRLAGQPGIAFSTLERARQLYRQRRQRAKHFDQADALFAEPFWDILLDLFVQEGDGRRVSVSSACYGAAVPATTGLRALEALQKMGLVERCDCEHDGRRRYVALTAIGRAQLTSYLEAEIP